jgi:RNA 2',3'-cyclic 3'-phosphodiesterase
VTEDVRHRLFIALEVREPARSALSAASAPLRLAYPGLRWVDPAMWHVTLAFVGSVDAEHAAAVDEAAATVAARHDAFVLRLTGRVGTFGRSVLYAELDVPEDLRTAHLQLCDELEAAGFPVDRRPFTPHVTLGRAPRGSRVPPQLLSDCSAPPVRWSVAELQVVRSRLRVGGAVHEVRSAHELSAASSEGAEVC